MQNMDLTDETTTYWDGCFTGRRDEGNKKKKVDFNSILYEFVGYCMYGFLFVFHHLYEVPAANRLFECGLGLSKIERRITLVFAWCHLNLPCSLTLEEPEFHS